MWPFVAYVNCTQNRNELLSRTLMANRWTWWGSSLKLMIQLYKNGCLIPNYLSLQLVCERNIAMQPYLPDGFRYVEFCNFIKIIHLRTSDFIWPPKWKISFVLRKEVTTCESTPMEWHPRMMAMTLVNISSSSSAESFNILFFYWFIIFLLQLVGWSSQQTWSMTIELLNIIFFIAMSESTF